MLIYWRVYDIYIEGIYIYRGYLIYVVFFQRSIHTILYIYRWDMLGIFLCNYCIYIYGMIMG